VIGALARIGSRPRDRAGRKPGETVGMNWRSRPLRGRVFTSKVSQADVTRSRGRGRTLPSCDQGARRRAGAPATATTKVARGAKPTASRVTPRLPGFGRCGRTQSVQAPAVATASQCGKWILAVSDDDQAAERFRFRSRKHARGSVSHGVSRSRGGRRDHGGQCDPATSSERGGRRTTVVTRL
jgi:hypothetical protein